MESTYTSENKYCNSTTTFPGPLCKFQNQKQVQNRRHGHVSTEFVVFRKPRGFSANRLFLSFSSPARRTAEAVAVPPSSRTTASLSRVDKTMEELSSSSYLSHSLSPLLSRPFLKSLTLALRPPPYTGDSRWFRPRFVVLSGEEASPCLPLPPPWATRSGKLGRPRHHPSSPSPTDSRRGRVRRRQSTPCLAEQF